MDGTGRTLGGGGNSFHRGVVRKAAALQATTRRVGVPPVCAALPCQYAPVSRNVIDEFFDQPGPCAYEVVEATDINARLRECDHSYMGGGSSDGGGKLPVGGAGVRGRGASGAGGVLSEGDSDLGEEAPEAGNPAGEGSDFGAGSDTLDEALLEDGAGALFDRLPRAHREHSSFASGVTRFDAPVAASNYRITACPAVHVVPDPTRYPLDDGAMPSEEHGPGGRMPSEQAKHWMHTGRGFSQAKRECPFGDFDGEKGQEMFYRPKPSLVRAAAQGGSSVQYELTRSVPRDAFPACVLKHSEWGGPLAALGQCAQGPGDYEAGPGSVQVLDEVRQSAPFSDTTTREPLFCQNPKLRTDQGFR